jgi:nucleoside-diphosphate-sugar epimerase
MRVTITGGAGYLGSMLAAELLAAGHEVRAVDSLAHGGESLLGLWSHPRFRFVRGDLREPAAVAAAAEGAEAVVHLAAIVGDPACARDPEQARAVNLDASRRLIEAARGAGHARFVFASTCSNYGRMADPERYVDEEAELRPVSLYAETKVAIERELLEAPADGRWCPTALRFATLYGVSPRMRFDLTVNEFVLELVARGRLEVFGEQFWRPYVHVADAASGIRTVLEAPATRVARRVFNVGATDQNFTKQQLVGMITERFAPRAEVKYVHRAEDPRDYRVSFARIADELGFHPRRTVPDGIAELAQLVADGVLARPDEPRYRN